ncbi:MAG: hypothetical protein ACP5E9_08295 [Candidatus Methanospirareceae archaeon]
MSWDDEDLTKAVRVLAGTATVPFKLASDLTGNVLGSLEGYVSKPTKLAATLIEWRISTLQAITKLIEKEITLLEQYKTNLEQEPEKKEKVSVE